MRSKQVRLFKEKEGWPGKTNPPHLLSKAVSPAMRRLLICLCLTCYLIKTETETYLHCSVTLGLEQYTLPMTQAVLQEIRASKMGSGSYFHLLSAFQTGALLEPAEEISALAEVHLACRPSRAM